MYYCSECKRKHRPSSSVYKKHLKHRKIEKDKIPSDKVIPCNIDYLPDVARRQINRYIHKMLLDKEHNYSKWKNVYIREINKIILHEDNDMIIKL